MDTLLRLVLSLLFITLSHIQQNGVEAQLNFPSVSETCNNCIPLNNCPRLLALLRTRIRKNTIIVKDSICSFASQGSTKVCCDGSTSPTPTPPTKVSLLPSECGYTNIGDRVIGGKNAPLGGYPWMAVLGYKQRGLNALQFLCGGTLINERYILTAAHCVHPDELLPLLTLSIARLGEWHTRSNPDCEVLLTGTICSDPVLDAAVESTITHPDYDTRGPYTDDIALVRLKTPVTTTRDITPVCLPQANLDIPVALRGGPAVITGWGLTENGTTSDILQELNLPLFPLDECNSTFLGSLRTGQLCFGGVNNKDSCKGDSGGPLVLSGPHGPPYVQIGLVSYGTPVCGLTKFPGVYTSISFYIKWIESTLKP